MYDLLICNGTLPPRAVSERLARGAMSITCADGGANKAHEYGIRPDTIIGDLDSISENVLTEFQEQKVDVLHLARQDDTDFEKAMKFLRDRSTELVVAIGLTGGLLDHTLGNLSILQRYIGDMRIVIFDRDYRVDVITGDATFKTRPGGRVSVFPLQAATGVVYEGLKYQLPSGALMSGNNEGTCNTAVTDTFTISLTSGILLVFRELTEELLEV